jgi:hypothetical protein
MMPADSTYVPVEDDIEETKSPLEYFKQFWPDEMNDLVVEELQTMRWKNLLACT